jgi:RNA-directed DNA polymerase
VNPGRAEKFPLFPPRPLKDAREQHRWLRQVLTGHYQYFGVIFNYRSLRVFKECVVRQWRKTLGQRSQKGRMNWVTFRQLLNAVPLPEPGISQAWR